MIQNRGFGLQTPCFAQTLSFVGGSEGLGEILLREFGKGIPDKAFHVEVPRGIPFEFCK